ncbi:MAG: hypothetical protein J6T98_11675 [Salinivirgaceae bacterium]|nr:hypothetical protein [Salinivirgaceae bacterium]
MTRLSAVAVLLLFVLQVQAQIVDNSWRDHLNYTNGQSVAVTGTEVYCAAGVGLFCYDKEDGRIRHLTTIEGLSDMGVGSIAYNERLNILVVGYTNGNIDLIDDDERIFNMPGLKDKNMSVSKRVNHINFDGDKAYLSCDFGLTVVDLKLRKFVDTYVLTNDGRQIKIKGSQVFGEYLYAFSEYGLIRGRLDNLFLSDFRNWEYVSIDTERMWVNTGCEFNGKLYVSEDYDDNSSCVMAYDGQNWTVVWDSLPSVKSLTSRDGLLVVCTSVGMTSYEANLHQHATLETEYVTMGFADGDLIWYSDSYYSLGRYSDGDFMAIVPEGPWSNRFYSVCYNAGKLLVAPGGISQPSGNMYIPADVFSYDGSRWEHIDRNVFLEMEEMRDVIGFATHGNPNHYIAIAWRYGIWEYNNGVGQHITVNKDEVYGDAVSGCAFDSRGNLWTANAFSQIPISVRTAGGDWYSCNYGGNMIGQHTGKLICTRNDDLWLVQPRGGKILVWNANGTPETASDDNYLCFLPCNESGGELNSNINDIVQDRNGAVWIASDEGVYVYDHPEYILQGKNFFARYPQMIEEGYYQSLLITEVVNTIAVDGGNRKWIGTESGGLFVISPDGTEQYAAYNKDNSPLFSNNVMSLAIDDDKGIIYIVTDRGLQSAVISSTKPDAGMSSVFAAPNPVPPDYYDDVTIRGLAEQTVVRITDLRGNLVHETMSNGGSALWNLCNRDGRRVETGIYLIQCTTTDGVTRNVGKIHVVK